jgi:ribonuclease HI
VIVIQLACDGSGSVTGTPGGWAFILRAIDSESGEILREREGFGGAVATTSQRMEQQSLLEGLLALERPTTLTIVSDSEYIQNPFRKEWVTRWRSTNFKKVKNVDMWEKIIPEVAKHEIEWVWVKGHTGHALNERCDKLAGDCRKAVKLAIESNSFEGLDFAVDRTEMESA